MKIIKLKDLLNLIDDKEIIELYVYNKFSMDDKDLMIYVDIHKYEIYEYSNLSRYLKYRVIFMYSLDGVLHIEVHQ